MNNTILPGKNSLGNSRYGNSTTRPLDPKQLAMRSTANARVMVPYDTACRFQVLPLSIQDTKPDRTLILAAQDALSLETINTLKFITNCKIDCVYFNAEVLESALFRAYHGDDSSLQSTIKQLIQATPPPLDAHDFATRHDDSKVGQFVWALIRFAIARGASDIHLTPLANGLALRVRIDGQLLDNNELPVAGTAYDQIARYILIHSGLDPNESAPQDGLLNGRVDHLPRIRVSSIQSLHGLAIALRLPLAATTRDLSKLQVDDSTIQILNNFLIKRQGLCLIAGPTGGGKTTVLYSIANSFIARGVRIITVEDPVENHLNGALQIEISEEMDAQKALSACLRQDPDAFMVGELRTAPTATTVVNAAYSGHGIFTSLHAGGIIEALLRLRAFAIDISTCCSALHSIHALRLAPTLCPNCKIAHLSATQAAGISVFQRVGCAQCNYTGYQGRTCLSESIQFTANLRSKLDTPSWSRSSLSGLLCGNYTSMSTQALRLLKDGHIDAETFSQLEQS